jgi:hypothetical protein
MRSDPGQATCMTRSSLRGGKLENWISFCVPHAYKWHTNIRNGWGEGVNRNQRFWLERLHKLHYRAKYSKLEQLISHAINFASSIVVHIINTQRRMYLYGAGVAQAVMWLAVGWTIPGRGTFLCSPTLDTISMWQHVIKHFKLCKECSGFRLVNTNQLTN